MDNANRLKIRLGTDASDIERWAPIFEECHRNSRFADYPYDMEKTVRSAQHCCADADFNGWLIAELDGEPVGFVFCMIGELTFAKNVLSTTVVTFYIRPQFKTSLIGGKAALSLIRGLIKWSKLRNAKEIFVYDTSEIDTKGTARFFQRLGFKYIGANFALPLSNTTP
ncbi:MAG: GNAT family N-acetyltransferase [Pseudomonadota bacterium]